MIANTNYAVIVAGGKGIRMGAALPKQFLRLAGRPLLAYSIDAFLKFDPQISIIVVLPESHLSFKQEIADLFPQNKHQIQTVAGGASRFRSVQNGLAALSGPGIVFVHDGVRPFISQEILSRCLKKAEEFGSAIPAIGVSDSILQWNGSRYARIDRSQLRAAQTPQTFRTALLLAAYEQPFQELFTDEASVVEASGARLSIVEGDRANIKITTPEDLAWAEFYLKNKERENESA